MSNEAKRQYIHVLLFLFAFLLKYLNKFQAVLLVLGLLAFTLLILPKLKAKTHFYRSTEKVYSQGAIAYFLVLLILVLVMPPAVVAASWAILALGDGMATLFGQHFKARELPWNKRKTFAGFFAFLIFATFGSLILLKWMIGGISYFDALSISFKAALAAAIVESMPVRINDNITVAIVSAVVLSLLI